MRSELDIKTIKKKARLVFVAGLCAGLLPVVWEFVTWLALNQKAVPSEIIVPSEASLKGLWDQNWLQSFLFVGFGTGSTAIIKFMFLHDGTHVSVNTRGYTFGLMFLLFFLGFFYGLTALDDGDHGVVWSLAVSTFITVTAIASYIVDVDLALAEERSLVDRWNLELEQVQNQVS